MKKIKILICMGLIMTAMLSAQNKNFRVGLGVSLTKINVYSLYDWDIDDSVVPMINIPMIVRSVFRVEPSFGLIIWDGELIYRPRLGIFGQITKKSSHIYFGIKPGIMIVEGDLEVFSIDPGAGFEYLFGDVFSVGFDTMFNVQLVQSVKLGFNYEVLLRYYFL